MICNSMHILHVLYPITGTQSLFFFVKLGIMVHYSCYLLIVDTIQLLVA